MSAPHVAIRLLALGTVLAMMTGCARSILPATPSGATRVEVPAAEPVTVEIRYYAHAPTVTILAWPASEMMYGLRAWLRRDGSLIEGHRLYVSTYYLPTRPAVVQAVTADHVLELTGIWRDGQWCIGGKPCSPPETFGVIIPDTLLRAGSDSVAVVFYERSGRRVPITLPRTLIHSYLGRVDSVVAVMRRKQS